MIIDYTNKKTGEMLKPYESPEHENVRKTLEEYLTYVHDVLKGGDATKISRLDGDTLSEALMVLAGYYDYFSSWLADERFHIAELKNALEEKFATEYLAFKKEEGQTNETARMEAKLACREDQADYDKHKHGFDYVETKRKACGKYHDTIRSQLGYEKSLTQMTR